VLRIGQNPSATTNFGTSVTSFDMTNAFVTNFDDVTNPSYAWLTK